MLDMVLMKCCFHLWENDSSCVKKYCFFLNVRKMLDCTWRAVIAFNLTFSSLQTFWNKDFHCFYTFVSAFQTYLTFEIRCSRIAASCIQATFTQPSLYSEEPFFSPPPPSSCAFIDPRKESVLSQGITTFLNLKAVPFHDFGGPRVLGQTVHFHNSLVTHFAPINGLPVPSHRYTSCGIQRV